ncbi:MAG: hypothetical protein KC464_26445 [Myxococcales bacterium]|nr:hypothetical protein [Myxococcales bacterium]
MGDVHDTGRTMTGDATPDAPVGTAARARRHGRTAAWLARASDDELMGLLSSPRLHEVGNAALRLPDDVGLVFVKLLPMTALELAPQHHGTTVNRYQLPPYYQYRIGSCGLGAWRELEVHRAANDWVLSGRCGRFPLLHHWRVLPLVPTGHDDRRELRHWGDDPAIPARVAAIAAATSSAVLFLEHFPTTLGAQVRRQLTATDDRVALLLELERSLTELLDFVHGQGVIHLDAHLENLLGDGTETYLTDFGLAVSRGFELSAAEVRFFEAHRNFDRCTVINALVRALAIHHDPRPDYRQSLRELAAGTPCPLAAASARDRAYLLRRTPLTLAVGALYDRLLADITSPYPTAAFDALLADLAA